MPETILLNLATADDFTPLTDTIFTILLENGQSFEVTLTNVRVLGGGLAGKREPFKLTFSGTPGFVLSQQIYRLTHPNIEDLEIFIVPIAATAQATTYEAIFA
ncbi:MAG: hypothetical protein JWQ02_725 [Capsulimonas sp.]|nr:hypothetical protein [Capsulimonas sp.]